MSPMGFNCYHCRILGGLGNKLVNNFRSRKPAQLGSDTVDLKTPAGPWVP